MDNEKTHSRFTDEKRLISMIYKVMVDDNFDFMETEKRTILGELETLEAAIEACKRIVNQFLESAYKPGMSAEALFLSHKTYGEDPWIIGAENNTFSAWKYAEKRCAEIRSKSCRL